MPNKVYYTFLFILVSITLLYATFQAVVAQEELKRVYSTLSSRCEKPSHFEKDTLSCVVTYQLVP